MSDIIKNNSKLKKTVPVLLILFILESIAFQVISTWKFNDFRYHNHILDDGTILTYNELTDKKGGLYDISDDYCIQFNKVATVNGSTVIDALLVNSSAVNLSGVHFYIQCKKLTEKGKIYKTEHKEFSRKDFENDELCVDLKNLSAGDVDVYAEPGTPAAIQFRIKDHSLAADEVLFIRGYPNFIQYKSR